MADDALAALPPAYRPLFESAQRVAFEDERVLALWLGGSLARGDADAVSDLDLLVAVRDDAHAEFAREWRAWLVRITPTVLARPLPFLPGSFYSLTPGALRLDVVVEAAGKLASTPFRTRRVVFDRAGLAALIPAVAPLPGPSQERIAAAIEEFFRVAALLEVGVVRNDLLLVNEGVQLVRGLLHQLFCEANAPLAPAGFKKRSANLTPAQRALLESLPTGGNNWDGVLAANKAVARAFLASAREIAPAHGVAWPHELEATVRAHLRSRGLPPLD